MKRALLLLLALTPLLLPAADKDGKKAAEAARRFSQLGLAFHNYHDTHGHFPPAAICDKDGKPLLSWRVAILPYIEEGELYKQFKLNEAWDSAHNKKLLAKMPKFYGDKAVKAGDPEPGASSADTTFQVFTGPGTLYPTLGTKPRITSITDGTSNTFLVAEAGKAVPWTKPADIAIDAKTFPKLGGKFEKIFHVVVCDGSAREVKRAAPEAALRIWVTPSGGEVPNPKDIEP